IYSWDRETIQLVQPLTPRETVVFIVDARISFDTFRNSMVATVTSKTIITINPDTSEANQLFGYVRELSENGQLDEQETELSENELESIGDVLTVSQAKAIAQESCDGFYGVTYGFITTLGLDSSISKVIRSRCARCKFQVSEEVGTCTNTGCPNQGQSLEVTAAFHLLVDISDHTGTLQTCSLSGSAAEKTLGCTVSSENSDFLLEKRTAMKWRFLLERCKIYLKVFPSSKRKNGMRVSVLSCTHADPVEVNQSMSALT
uniref:Methionine sulfoxide reductase B1b n=1 Tax=Electrophorus electricus TaxID=8005 RepID=A0A4W4F311_ELEEL